MKSGFRFLLLVFVAILISGCSSVGSYKSSSVYDEPLVGEITKKSISYEGIERNPVIVIPGFLGSKLIDSTTGETVWGKFSGKDSIMGLSRWLSKERIRSLSLPIETEKHLRQLKDAVVSTVPLDRIKVKLLGFSFHLHAYQDMLEALRFGGYYDQAYESHKERKYDTCFQFGYDWRRDLVENTQRLDEFIKYKKLYMQSKYEELYGIKDYDVQFDIVAHSMGGLLTRYYLRYGAQDLPSDGTLPKLTWEGSKHIDKVIIIGTPNAGYLDSLVELVKGLKVARGVPTYQPVLVGTFPSMYQMLPLTRNKAVVSKNSEDDVLDVFDPELWIRMKWGLADPGQDKILKIILPDVKDKEKRREIAINYLRTCLRRARQFTDSLMVDAVPPNDVALHLFLGNAVETSEVACVDECSGDIEIIKYGPGDGKVLSTSALMDERVGNKWVPFIQSPIKWSSVTFLFAAHMGITKDPVFFANMLYILLGSQTKTQSSAG